MTSNVSSHRNNSHLPVITRNENAERKPPNYLVTRKGHFLLSPVPSPPKRFSSFHHYLQREHRKSSRLQSTKLHIPVRRAIRTISMPPSSRRTSEIGTYRSSAPPGRIRRSTENLRPPPIINYHSRTYPEGPRAREKKRKSTYTLVTVIIATVEASEPSASSNHPSARVSWQKSAEVRIKIPPSALQHGGRRKAPPGSSIIGPASRSGGRAFLRAVFALRIATSPEAT